MRSRALLGMVVIAGLGAPSTARAYRTLADDPSLETTVPPRWLAAEVSFDLHAPLRAPLPGVVDDAARLGFEAWAAPECSAFVGRIVAPTSAAAAPEDGRNTIGIVTDGWTDLGFHRDAGATTDLQLRRDVDGRWAIVEADIYVDWERRSFDSSGRSADGIELSGVLTHEIAHVLGLMHPCELDPSDGPACEPDARASIVYPVYVPGATTMLSADDQAGVCALYPAGECGGCAPDEICVAGACQAGTDCVGGPCDGGVAARQCGEDSFCSPSDRCAVGTARAGTCVAEGAEGAPCARSGDCASGLCLAGLPVGAYCARACSPDGVCGTDEACISVDGRDVCAPQPSSGCAVSGRGAGVTNLLIAMLIGAALARRRRSMGT